MTSKKKTKFVSAEEAVKAIESYDRVVLGNFCAEPVILPERLMDRAEELEGVKLFHLTPFGEFQERYATPGMEKHIRCVTAFCGRMKGPREVIKQGRGDFAAVSLGNIPYFLVKSF